MCYLLCSCEEVLGLVLGFVARIGWDDCCWTDDGLSFKKMYPGHQFASKSQKWRARVRVTDESMELMVQRAQAKFEKLPTYLKVKYVSSALDKFAETAAAVWHLGNELALAVPIPAEVIKREWYDAWASGSEQIDMEVQSMLLEKADNFDVTQHIPTLKQLIGAHIFNAPTQRPPVELNAIEVDNFNLMMKKVDYDVNVFQTWQKKCCNVHAAQDHARRAHRLEERKRHADAADLFLQTCTKLLLWDVKAESVISDLLTFRRDSVASPLGIASDKVPSIVFLNWTSLSLIPSSVQEKQAAVLTWTLHDNIDSVSPVISPVFCYGRGKLHLQETQMMQYLTTGHHNVDIQFSILFKDQCDLRDTRPMMYPGRLVFPGPLVDMSKSPWHGCELRRLRRTAEVPQLAASAMRELEDLADDALPASSDVHYLHGAPKFAQLGSRAWSALISGLLDGSNLKDVPAAIMVDLFVHVGDSLRAFCVQRINYSTTTSLFWVGICLAQKEADWIYLDTKDFLVEQYEARTLPLPRGSGPDLGEFSPESVDTIPPKPKLNVLVINSENQLQMPAAIVKDWQLHPKFGTQFSVWLDNFVQTYSIAEARSMESSMDSMTPEKRKAAMNLPGESPSKVPKLQQDLSQQYLIESKDITETLLAEAQLPGKTAAAWYQLRTGHQIYLVNKGANDWQSPSLCLCAAYGKGTFKLIKPDQTDVDLSDTVEFNLQSAKDFVVFNGQLATVGQIVNEQLVKKPEAEVCYHKMTVSDDKPKEFTLEQTHKIVFVAAKEDKDPNKLSGIAGKEPTQSYTSAPCLQVLWSVRWTAKGLMPVKPAVYLTGTIVVPPGKALHCTGTKSVS